MKKFVCYIIPFIWNKRRGKTVLWYQKSERVIFGGFSSIDREEVTRKFSAVTDTSFWVGVTWVYEIVKIHQTQHLKSLHLLFMHIIPQSNDKSFYRSSITFYNNTQSCIKWRWGIFFTPSIGRQKVAFSSGCVTWAFLKRKPIGLMNLSYLGGFWVKPSPTKQTLVTIFFYVFFLSLSCLNNF